MSMVVPSQAYTLLLKPQPAPLVVLNWSGKAAISQLYEYKIEFTSAADISMDEVVGRPATFSVEPVDPSAGHLQQMFGERWKDFSKMPKRYDTHGIIQQFEVLGTSADETRYRVTLAPKIADLSRVRKSRLFQKQSVVEIITDTLRHYGYRLGVDFDFLKLRGKYKRHEYITQYHESTFGFLQRLCAEEGLWFRFEQKHDRTIIVFGDDLDAYARKQRIIPYRSHSGLESAGDESIRSLRTITQRAPEAIQLNDYNHRQADVNLLVEANAAPANKTTDGVDNHWGEHYETLEEGKAIARRRHEEHLATQISYRGRGNPFSLEIGEVVGLDVNPKDAPHGLFVTSIRCGGGRAASYWCAFRAIPADRRWRTSIESVKRPKIEGVLPARIDSPGKYTYSYVTEKGLYVVKMPFDLDEWSPGGRSRAIRMMRPYAGANYGHHFPLIDGAEVALIFTAQDPNRPVIAGSLHDSLNPDLVNNLNHTRNILRTAALNEMRMEDKRGFEHIHLTTPFQTSELNLGHMVDGDRKERGRGAELRSDEHIALRGGKGVFISADTQNAAGGKQLDMQPAQALLEQALLQTQSLAEAAKAAQAIAADYENQKALLDGTLRELRKAAVLVSAPAGVGVASGDHLQLSAAKNILATAGGNADIGVLRRFTVAAGEAVSIFAQRLGMKLIAQGKVEVQSQGDEMALSALKDVTISSVDGRLVLSAAKEVWIGAGGSYIKINGNRIENGTPGDILEKCAVWSKPSAASAQISSTLPNALPSERLILNLASSPSAMTSIPQDIPYRLYAQGALVAQGLTDPSGRILVDHQPSTQSYRLELANGVTYNIPVSEEFLGDAENGQLANQGFHFFEQGSNGDGQDRAVHRKTYYGLLNPATDISATESQS
ncbi:Rhs element Vgr protein [Caballeronia cordobensis]|uniref:Rhs element Vgr protein n=1 Tax=Caballeronia cordobensis TaxID=1353886 RepID=A0A158IWX0_CABCO|nr:type VI secretion system Vgr family protein [Caballeronia cordobensis]SAL61078.1 Rhs element Vgr protein [Caballeronia cordobensis]